MPDALTLVSSLGSIESKLERGAYLFHRDDPTRWVFVVVDGGVDLERRQEDGTSLVLQRARSREVVAEASLHSDRYHCDARGARPSRLLKIDRAQLLEALRSDPDFALSWMVYLGHQVRQARLRAEILARRTVAERLDLWLEHSGPLPRKGERRALAEEIAVSPEALYRELSRRRPSG